MEPKRKLIGYYSSGGKCRKAYNFYDKNKKRYLKQKKTANGKKILSKHRVFKKKSNCVKHLKSQQNKMKKRLKRKSPKRKSTKRKSPKRKSTKRSRALTLKQKMAIDSKNKFGSETCHVLAPFHGQYVPFNNMGDLWPNGGIANMDGQFRRMQPTSSSPNKFGTVL